MTNRFFRLAHPAGLMLAFAFIMFETPITEAAEPEDRVYSVEGRRFRVVANAGKIGRNHAVTSFVVKPGDELQISDDTPVTLEHDGKKIPGQIELIPKTKLARIWCVVSDLGEGEKREYIVNLGEKCTEETFRWKDTEGKLTTLFYGDRPQIEYRYEAFDPARIEETKKPFHMVYDPSGSHFITKGLGGQFPHHRGIYFGYNKCKIGKNTYDTWHCHRGEHQLHRKIIFEHVGPVFGGHAVEIHWNDREGRPFAKEIRTVRVFHIAEDQLLIDFRTLLEAVDQPVILDGDRQHAGVQFRSTNELSENPGKAKPRYLRPEQWKDLPENKQFNTSEHKDLPWNSIRFFANEKPVTVAYLSDPKNPGPAEFSERLYGRFGEFFKFELRKDNPLRAHYRWWIVGDHKVDRNMIHRQYEDLVHPVVIQVEN